MAIAILLSTSPLQSGMRAGIVPAVAALPWTCRTTSRSDLAAAEISQGQGQNNQAAAGLECRAKRPYYKQATERLPRGPEGPHC